MDRQRRLTLGDLELSTGATRLMPGGTRWGFLDRVFQVDIRPLHQALQPTQTAKVKE